MNAITCLALGMETTKIHTINNTYAGAIISNSRQLSLIKDFFNYPPKKRYFLISAERSVIPNSELFKLVTRVNLFDLPFVGKTECAAAVADL